MKVTRASDARIAVGPHRFETMEVVAIVLLVVGLALRLALMTGPMGSDDMNYFRFSRQLINLEPLTELNHHAGRLLFLLVIGVPAALMGSITSGIVLNIALLTVRDVAVVWFVRRGTDAASAAAAAAVLSLNAISVTYAGVMSPDALSSSLLFAAAVLIHRGIAPGQSRRARLVFASGALAALSYSAKDVGILITAPSMLFIALATGIELRPRIRLMAVYGAGFALVALLEMLMFRVISGDFLYRSHAFAVYHSVTPQAAGLIDFIRATYWNLRLVTATDTASLPVLVLAAVVFVAALVTRSSHALFTISGLFIGGYLIFGSSSFTRWMPLWVQDRYFEPIIPFLAVSTGALLFRLRQRRPWAYRAVAAGVVCLPLASLPSVAGNAGDVTFSGVGRNAGLAIRSVMTARPDLPVIVSPMLYRSIEPFVEPSQFRALKQMDGSSLQRGFYIQHPWEAPGNPWQPSSAATPLLAAVGALPVYLVVDEDQRHLGAIAGPRPPNRGAIVRIKPE